MRRRIGPAVLTAEVPMAGVFRGRRWILFALAAMAVVALTLPVRTANVRIVLIAGRPSHPPGMHEFRAGAMLLQKALASVPGVTADVYTMGWPTKGVDG